MKPGPAEAAGFNHDRAQARSGGKQGGILSGRTGADNGDLVLITHFVSVCSLFAWEGGRPAGTNPRLMPTAKTNFRKKESSSLSDPCIF